MTTDYTSTSGTATVLAGTTTATIDVPIVGDTTAEGNETFAVNLSAPTGATIGTASATGTILEDDPPTGLTVGIGNASVVEGNSATRQVSVPVTLSDPSGSDVSVDYATASGTATAGTDFTSASGTLTIPAGDITGFVAVDVPGDITLESGEAFSITLSNAVGATIGRTVGTGTIANDDLFPSEMLTWGTNATGAPASPAVTSGWITAPRQLGTVATWKSVATSPVSLEPDFAAIRTDGSLWTWGAIRLVNSETARSPRYGPGSDHDRDQLEDRRGRRLAYRRVEDRRIALGAGEATATGRSGTTHSPVERPRFASARLLGRRSPPASRTPSRSAPTAACGRGATTAPASSATTRSIERHVPTRIGTGVAWATITVGYDFTLGTLTDHTLWSWGGNVFGQLGDGTIGEHHAPRKVGLATTWATVAAGNGHVLATRHQRHACGRGATTGRASSETAPPPMRSRPCRSARSRRGPACPPADRTAPPVGATARCGPGEQRLGPARRRDDDARLTPTQAGVATHWTDPPPGSTRRSRCTPGARCRCGETTPAGRSAYRSASARSRARESGVGPWKSASLSAHGVAVRGDGTLWAWGSNESGQLGNGTLGAQAAPVQIGSSNIWATVKAGGVHTVGVRTDGTLWAWGYNGYGQLGTSSTLNRSVPTRVGTATDWKDVAAGPLFTLALKTNGSLWAWGDNGTGQLGDGTHTERQAPVHIGTATWKAIVAGNGFSVGLQTNGSLWAWGDNGFGQLGDGTSTQRIVPTHIGTATWTSIAAGGFHTLAIRTGQLWSWGDNSSGQVGDNSLTQRRTPVHIGAVTTWSQIAAGASHSVATRTDGSVWGWGDNSGGELGDGTTVRRLVPTRAGLGTTWTKIAAGDRTTLALRK